MVLLLQPRLNDRDAQEAAALPQRWYCWLAGRRASPGSRVSSPITLSPEHQPRLSEHQKIWVPWRRKLKGADCSQRTHLEASHCLLHPAAPASSNYTSPPRAQSVQFTDPTMASHEYSLSCSDMHRGEQIIKRRKKETGRERDSEREGEREENPSSPLHLIDRIEWRMLVQGESGLRVWAFPGGSREQLLV